jgi:hypothetical protein
MSEDSLRPVTIPRLRGIGATERELARIDYKESTPWSFPRDLGGFAQRMHELRIKLAVLDPVDRTIPGISHASSYPTLDRLHSIAEANDMAVVLIGHTNKGGPFRSVEAGLGGSRRLLAVCRSVFVWGPEPFLGLARPDINAEPSGKCLVLAQEYSNYGPAANGIDGPSQLWERVFVRHPIEGERDVPVYSFVADVDYRPLDVLNARYKKRGDGPGRHGTKREEAKRLILLLLNHAQDYLGLTASELEAGVVTTMAYSAGTFQDARAELVKEGAIERWKDRTGPWR